MITIINNVESKWADFEYIVKCPFCSDDKGHAGLFPNPFNSDQRGFSGLCLKCGDSFIDKTGYRKHKLDMKSAGFKPSSMEEYTTATPYHMNKPWHLKTAQYYHTLITRQSNTSTDVARTILKNRRMKPDLVDFLIQRGFGYTEPFTGPAIYGFNLDPKCEFIKEVSLHGGYDLTDKDRGNVHKYEFFNPSRAGLVLPLYSRGLMYSFQLRPVSGTVKYLPLKYIGKDRESSTIVGKSTVADQLIDETYNYFTKSTVKIPRGYTKSVYITEGVIKAEVVNFYFKRDCIGAISATALNSQSVKEELKKLREYEVVVCPDKDYINQSAIANNYYKLISWMHDNGFTVRILTWDHPSPEIDATLKGVDDALIQNEEDALVTFHSIRPIEFFHKMDKRVRSSILKRKTGGIRVVPGSVIPESLLNILNDKILKEDKSIISSPDLIYKTDDRVEVLIESLAKHKLVVDVSPTGSGKSHGAGLLRIGSLTKSFLEHRVWSKYDNGCQINMFGAPVELSKKEQEREAAIKENTVERVKYVSQSPRNNTVSTLESYKTVSGRNSQGWVFDLYLDKYRKAKPGETPLVDPNCSQAESVIELSRNRQLQNIKFEICDKCPHQQGCKYLAEAKISKQSIYTKMNVQSLKANKGDVIILDDPGSIEFFTSVALTPKDITEFFEMLSIKSSWKAQKAEVRILVDSVMRDIKLGKPLATIKSDLSVTGKLNQAAKWLSLPEPDKIPTQKIRIRYDGGMELDGKYRAFKGLKRWFFLFIEMLLGNSYGDLFYDAKNDSWIMKSIDPKFKDMLSTASAILILDATANKEFFEDIFGEKPFIISAEGDPFKNVKVTRVEGFSNTYSSFIKYEEKREQIRDKAAFINDWHKTTGQPSGLLTFSALLKDSALRDIWDPELTKGYWFCDERASNAFYHAKCTSMFLMGIPTPNVASIAAESGTHDRDEGSIWVGRPYGTVNDHGEKMFVISREAADDKVRGLIWYKKASAYVQALGRLRSLQRPTEQLNLIVMDTGPLPFAVNETKKVGEGYKRAEISITASELNRKLSYLDSLMVLVESMKAKYGNPLTFQSVEYLGKDLDSSAFYKLGCNIKTCATCDDMLSMINKAKINLKENPDLLINALAQACESDITPEEQVRLIKAEAKKDKLAADARMNMAKYHNG